MITAATRTRGTIVERRRTSAQVGRIADAESYRLIHACDEEQEEAMAEALGIDGAGGIDDSVDILGEVTLESFKANPTNIGPFGASVLSWSVNGPAGFHVKLASQDVAKTGTRVVQPPATTSYRLSAHAGQASRTLGTV